MIGGAGLAEEMKGDCYVLSKLKVREINRFRLNWAIICAVGYFYGLTSFITAPSLHQFITSSSNVTSDSQVEWPGLGLSETWYSWAVSALNVGIFVGALLFSVFARSFYYKYIIIGSLFIAISSGVIYSFAVQGWMVITGRFLSGVFIGISLSITRTYIGESSDKVIQMRKEASLNSDEQSSKKTLLKYTNFFMQFTIAITGLASGPALGALASQIPSLDPFRWPGYYLIIHGGLLNIFVMLFFCEKWDDVNRKKKLSNNDNNNDHRNRLKCQKPDQPIQITLIFISSFVVLGWVDAIVETLENPVLSGNFGLTIKYQSYIFFATLAMKILSNTTIYILQRVHFDNRFLVIGGFIVGCIGTVLVGDWQSIRGDPCNAVNSDLQCNTMEFGSGMMDEFNCIVPEKGQFCDFLDNSSLIECCNSTNTSTAGCICESLSDVPNYNCYWNPNSIITGDYCERCRPVCLSRSHTLSFIQFVIGVFAISGSIGFNRILLSIVVSDLIGNSKKGSGWLFGLMMGAGGLSQSTGPLWTNPLYLLVGNRTWLVSAILSSLQFILIILFIIFFKQFKAKKEVDGSIRTKMVINQEDKRELLQFEDMDETTEEQEATLV